LMESDADYPTPALRRIWQATLTRVRRQLTWLLWEMAGAVRDVQSGRHWTITDWRRRTFLSSAGCQRLDSNLSRCDRLVAVARNLLENVFIRGLQLTSLRCRSSN
jgi:hypothetical protein